MSTTTTSSNDPDTIRREIEETRERMGETVDAIGYKADVPSRAKERVGGTITGVKDRIAGTAGAVSEATPTTGDVADVAKRGASVAQENPLGLAIGAAAAGFLAGMLIPTTSVEEQRIGPVADQVKDQVREVGQEAIEHGKEIAKDVAGAAQESVQQVAGDVKESAQEAAKEHGDQLKESVQEHAQTTRS